MKGVATAIFISSLSLVNIFTFHRKGEIELEKKGLLREICGKNMEGCGAKAENR